MKAQPLAFDGTTYNPVGALEATHVLLAMPGPIRTRLIPIERNGWVWNYDTEKPTLKPSILSRTERDGVPVVCHSFVTDGDALFLSDCSHELRGQTVELLNVD